MITCFLSGAPSSNDNGSSSDNIIVIVGAGGGVILLLLVIVVVLCVAIMCVKRFHKKGKFPTEYDKAFNDATKLNAAVTIEHNPSYDIKTNKVDYSSDVPVTPNPSYGVTTKPYSKATEDDYNYVQSNEFNQHTDLDKTIKLDINPSYGISRGKDRATSVFSETVTKFNTKAHDSSHNGTIAQCDYDYVHDDHFLCRNVATNAASDVSKDHVQIYITVDQTKPTDGGEYYVINQPQSDDPNYEITHDVTTSQQDDTLYI